MYGMNLQGGTLSISGSGATSARRRRDLPPDLADDVLSVEPLLTEVELDVVGRVIVALCQEQLVVRPWPECTYVKGTREANDQGETRSVRSLLLVQPIRWPPCLSRAPYRSWASMTRWTMGMLPF